MRNRYLEDRARNRRDMARGRGMRDGRNPYGSRGGYIRDSRGNDYGMDYRNDYAERSGRYDNRYNSDYRGSDYHNYPEYNREFNRLAENNMIPGVKGLAGSDNDYAMYDRYDGYDMGNDFASDYSQEEKEYKKHLKKWEEKLKKKDRFNMQKEQIIKRAESMQIKFKDFDEDEFYVTYLMQISDYPKVANDYNTYIAMAKDWLEDDDVKYQGGEKLCKYYYDFVYEKEDERYY